MAHWHPPTHGWRIGLVLLRATGMAIPPVWAAANAKVDFAKEVQPIFIKRCYQCHGPDKQKSGLRLDHKADAFKGGKSGKPVFVPGKSGESQILARVTSTDADEVMPPEGERLTEAQIQSLRRWID